MSYDPLDLKAQERAKEESERRAKVAQESEDTDVRWLMSSKRGRRIVWRLMDRCGVFRISFNPNSMTMAFNEGQRNEGLRILAQVHLLCPEMYPLMVKEAHERQHADDGSGKPNSR